MSRPSELGQLPTKEWERLQAMVERFESEWQRRKSANPSASVDLSDYLPRPGEPLRVVALHEFIKTDLEMQWRGGRSVILEDYLKRSPELGDASQLSANLIYEEFRVRQRYGDKPPLASYRERFPKQFEELKRRVEEQTFATMTPPPKPAGQAPAPKSAPVSPSSAPQLTPFRLEGTVIGHGYQLTRKIGKGGFGEVWEAVATGGIRVAVKIIKRSLDDKDAKREMDSLELMKNLRHPFLIDIHNF